MRDAEHKELIRQDHTDNYRAHRTRKTRRELNRQSHTATRYTVERLTHKPGIAGAVRDNRPNTTTADQQAERTPDPVDRDFTAGTPNRCWTAAFTLLTT